MTLPLGVAWNFCYGTGAAQKRPGDFEMQTWQAIFIGLVEGLTEFIPVSSTAHILLSERLLGLPPSGKAFEVVIQLGAILAIVVVYASRLWRMLLDLPRDQRTQKFFLAILFAFLPSVVIGLLAYKTIKDVLFGWTWLICLMLVVGGIVLLVVDRMKFEIDTRDAMDVTPKTAFKIGLCQCLALIPGISRSGATIVGGLLLGVERRAAAEFSFFLSLPTMGGACAYDLYKNWSSFTPDDVLQTGAGFLMAFISGIFVVRQLLNFISTRGLSFFGWWRIIAGGLGLGALTVLG